MKKAVFALWLSVPLAFLVGCGSSCNSNSGTYNASCYNTGASNYPYSQAAGAYGGYGSGGQECMDPTTGQYFYSANGSCVINGSTGTGYGGGYGGTYNQSTGMCMSSTGQQYYPQNGSC